MIEFQNVSYTYKKGYGVSNLNFLVENGDFTFLIGPTGSGKTTLMRLIYFDLIPSNGVAIVNGFRSSKISEKNIYNLRKSVGMVFQDYKLLADRNLYDNIALPLHVLGFNRKEILTRVEEALELVGLNGKEKHYPAELSGGEQQRASLARAIIKEPDIILADEPTGNLDPGTSKEIMNLLIKINNQGSTILMATHDYDMISNFPKRTLRLEDGKLFELSKKT